MSRVQSLIDEVEASFHFGTVSGRALILRRISDLFLASVDRLQEQQVGVFDDVLCGLIEKIERKAVAELSREIAELPKAPRMLSRRLSRDDDIDIAGPVLMHSVVLSDNDLVEVAQNKGQLHLEAIASRSHVSERVSDILIDRGNSTVLTTVASNAGARLSMPGYKSLAAKAESDANIASSLIGRSDLSPEMFRALVARASATVQQKLLATADTKTKEQVQGVIQSITIEISRNADCALSMSGTQAASQIKMSDKNKLRSELVDYATAGLVGQTVAALATLSELSIDTARQLLTRQDYELLLIVCKACGLGWLAVRAVLEMAANSRGEIGFHSAAYFDQYSKLSRDSAERVIRFCNVRKAASGAEIKKMLADPRE